MNVPAGAKVPLILIGASAETAARLDRHRDLIVRLARLDRVTLAGEVPKGAAQIVLDEATLVLPLAGIIDIAAERARLEREVKKLAGEIAGIDKKLANPAFIAKAPEEVVEEQRERRADAEAASRRLGQAVARLG
jgi:valyl-tRNA synthetase